MNNSLETCEIERCSVSEPLNAAVNDYVWKESRQLETNIKSLNKGGREEQGTGNLPEFLLVES